MTEKEQEKLKTLEKWETENQGLIKDGWKILEVYRQTSGSYNKYAVIECVHCGFTKLVLTNFSSTKSVIQICAVPPTFFNSG